MSCDLHLHTHYSDGNWSPTQVVDKAAELEFKCIAITDHDSVAGLPEAQLHAPAGLRVISGIEFNTIWSDSEGTLHDVHILGYFIDPNSRKLQELIEEQLRARLNYAEETVALLRSAGHSITLADVLEIAGNGAVGRPHICQAMLKAGICEDPGKAYLMLTQKNSAFKLPRLSITPRQALEGIKAARGLSSLAHPGKSSYVSKLVNELLRHGLNAIEAYHRGHSNSLRRKYEKMAQDNGLLLTGGSDCHGPFADFPASIGSVRLHMDLIENLEKLHEELFLLQS